jgi:hypothetical protein
MNPRVVRVRPKAEYKLEITFSNGEVRLYDCRPLLGFGVFQELRDVAYFNRAAALGGTVVWPHEQDICPDTLYADSEKVRRTARSRATTPSRSRNARRTPKKEKVKT